MEEPIINIVVLTDENTINTGVLMDKSIITNENLSVNEESNFNLQATVERCPHDQENPYTMINNALLRDENISPNCRWLLSYLLSNRANWKITVLQISQNVKKHLGIKKVYKIINEAIKAGYMKREDVYVSEGHSKLKRNVKYFISETPKFKKCFRDSHFCHDENGCIKERTSLKKEHIKKKKEREAPPPSVSLFIFKRVKMKQDQFDQLVKEFGETIVREKIASLDEYADLKSQKFKEYSCHYAVIRNWIKKDLKKPPPTVHQKFIDKIKNKFGNHKEISFHDSEVCFRTGMDGSRTSIKMKDPDFPHRVIDFLRRMGLDVSDLLQENL